MIKSSWYFPVRYFKIIFFSVLRFVLLVFAYQIRARTPMYVFFEDLFVSWCFEPSQRQTITSGLILRRGKSV